MKFKHRSLILIAGLVWLAIGIFLLSLGLRFVVENAPATGNKLVYLLTFGLVLGYVKGRFMLRKTVDRQVARISKLPSPAHIKHLYTKGHYLLIVGMMGLGMSMRFLPISIVTRGVIDIAVGSALMNGAMLYIRSAINYKYIKGS